LFDPEFLLLFIMNHRMRVSMGTELKWTLHFIQLKV